MKKYIFYTLATVVTFLTFSCSKDTEVQTPDKPVPVDPIVPTEKSVVLSGDVDATKVSSDNNGAYKWQASDIITILTDNGNNREFTAEEAGISTDFSGHIPDADELEGGFALYPASENHSISGTTITFNMPNELAWGADASYMPMYAPITIVEQKPSASFKAVGGALKLILYNIPSGATYLAFTAASVNIAGDFSLDTTAETPVISGGESKEIDINFSDNYSANKVFYIPLPPVTLTGGFTISIFDDETNELFSVTSTKGITIGRNKLVIAPALNCSTAENVFSEVFNAPGSSTEEVSAYAKAGQIAPTGANISYSTTGDNGNTKIYQNSESSANTAGGAAAGELFLSKKVNSVNGIFNITGIPTNIASNLKLSFVSNQNSDSNNAVTTSTTGVTVSNRQVTGESKPYTISYDISIENNIEASTFNLIFTNSTTSNNARIDDIKLVIPPTSATTPIITSGNVNLTIAVGALTKSTSVGITNPVDGLGLQYVLSKSNDKPLDWVDSVTIADGSLTVTATGANGEAEDREAILTLKATGATNKVINLKQTSALVAKPASISVVPGNATFAAQWTKAEHATGYKAYLHTAETGTPATGGTELTPSLDGSTYSVSQSGLTNGSTYYLYVKVNGVDEDYVADTGFTMVSFTPNDNTVYYEKVTSAPADWSGTYLIVWGSNAHYAITTNGLATCASVSIADNKIAATGHNSHSIEIEKDNSNYYIKLPSGKYISNGNGSSNTCTETDDKTTSLSFSISDGYVLITGANSKILQKNSSYYRFYTINNNYSKPMLFKLADPRSAAGLSWKKSGVAADSDGATMLTGDDTMPTISLDNPNSLTVSYSSSDAAVATINSSTGVLTLVSAGTTTISATFADGDASYKPQTVSYTLTVTDSRTSCATPSFSPAAGAVAADTEVTITSATSGATIYYTTDGSTPTTSSAHGEIGTPSAAVTIDEAKTIKAIAVKDDCKTSAVASGSYTIAGISTPLSDPSNVKVTAITTSSFTATWSNDTNASSYEWMLSTSSTAPASTSDSSVKAYGTSSAATLSSGTWTLNKSSITPSLDGKFYFYVKAKGSGAYTDSGYSSATKVILTLNFSSNIFSLSNSGNGASTETSKTYNNYTYKLYATNLCYWYSSSALFLGKSGSYLTVPAIAGVKLSSVTAGNKTGASTKVTVTICPTNSTTATTGGTASTITPGSSKTWNLTATSANTAYRLYVSNAYNVQFTTITLIYSE